MTIKIKEGTIETKASLFCKCEKHLLYSNSQNASASANKVNEYQHINVLEYNRDIKWNNIVREVFSALIHQNE